MIRQFEKQYSWLSNFTPCAIVLDGLTFSSVEHAYMSAKSEDMEWKLTCTDASIKPSKIKKMSRTIALPENWNSKRIEVMRECLNQKFRQEPFKTLLLETGDLYIQEGNYWGDKFWGVDMVSREGENHLGKLIMEIREELKGDRLISDKSFI
jgi:ribA/ribD-fused uncharacterized protein